MTPDTSAANLRRALETIRDLPEAEVENGPEIADTALDAIDHLNGLATSPYTSAAEVVAWQHRVFFDDTQVWSAWRAGRFPRTFDNDFEERELVKSTLDTSRAETAAANARADALELERDSAILGMSGWARRAGEAEGALRASEMAGIVDGWKTRAEAAEAKQAKAVEALKLLSRRSRTVIGGLSPGQSLMPAGASHTNAFEAAINEADRALTEIEGKSK